MLHLVYFWLPSADPAVERVAERVRRGGHNVREHKYAGDPIAAWRDGKVVLLPPEQIEV